MTILVHIGHPAHVHLFRNCMRAWEQRGHRVVVAIRERGIIAALLRAYGFSFVVASRARTGRLGQACELLVHDWHVWCLAVREKADLLIGTSVAAAHVSRVTRARSIIFEEDDADQVALFARLTYPFADRIVIPDCLRDTRTDRHVTYKSYHELAYLHPNHFAPDAAVLGEAGLEPGERLFILRHVALTAFHDVREQGFNAEHIRELVAQLSQKGRVIITAEGDLPEDLAPYQFSPPPHRILDLLAHASLVVSDSQTMTAEAAVLGVPSVRCNSFVGRLSYLEELEHRYGLTFGFHPGEEAAMNAKVNELLADPDLAEEWQRRRQAMLADKVDAAQWITDFVEEYGLET